MIMLSEKQIATVVRQFSGEDTLRVDRPKFPLIVLLRTFKIWMFHLVAIVVATYFALLWGIEYLIFTTLTEVLENQYQVLAEGTGVYFIGWGESYTSCKLYQWSSLGSRQGSALRLAYSWVAQGTTGTWRGRKPLGGYFRVRIELHRWQLVGSLPFVVFLYGWTAQKKIRWMVALTATAIQTPGVAIVSISSKAYLIDSFPKHAASAIGAGSIIMSFCGALILLAGPPLYAKLDLGRGSSVLGFIALAVTPQPIMFVRLSAQGQFQRKTHRAL